MEYYSLLGIPADAAEDDVRSAYKAMALKWHPDRQLQNAGEATSKFVQINDAYKGILRERRRARRKAEKPEQTPGASTSRAAQPTPPEAPKVAEDPPELPTEPLPVPIPVRQHCESSSSSTTSSKARGSGSSSSDSSSSRSSKNKVVNSKKNDDQPDSQSPASSQSSSRRTSVSSLFEDHRSVPTTSRSHRTPSHHPSHQSLSSTSTAPSSTSAASTHQPTSAKPTPSPASTTAPRACVYTYYSASEDTSDSPHSSRLSVNSTWSFRDADIIEIRPDARSDKLSSTHSSAEPGPSQLEGNNEHLIENPRNSEAPSNDRHSSRSSAKSRSSHRSAKNGHPTEDARRPRVAFSKVPSSANSSEQGTHEPQADVKSTHSSSRSSVKSGSSSSSSVNSDATSVSIAAPPVFEMPGITSIPDDAHSSVKSGRSKLRKQPKPPDHNSDKSSSHRSKTTGDAEDLSDRVILPVYDPPLLRESGGPKEWVFPLSLSLEDMFKGKKLRFRVIRYKLSGKKKNVILEFSVPPGCPNGTKIVFRGCGHELEDGTKQDVIFLVEEAKHDRFTRDNDDLIMDVRLPWLENLNKEKGEVHLNGIDGKPLCFDIDFATHKAYHGATAILNGGMPRRDGSGRGNLVVRWEIVSSPPSRWESLKNKLSFRKG